MFNSFHDVRTQPLAWISCATFVRMWLEKGLVSPKQWVGTWSGVSTFPGWKESARPADLVHGLLTRKLLEGTLGNPAVCLWGLSQIVKWTGQGLKGDRRVGYCWGAVVVALKDLNPVTWPGVSVWSELCEESILQRCVASCWLMYGRCKTIYRWQWNTQPSSPYSFIADWPSVLWLTLPRWDLSIHK